MSVNKTIGANAGRRRPLPTFPPGRDPTLLFLFPTHSFWTSPNLPKPHIPKPIQHAFRSLSHSHAGTATRATIPSPVNPTQPHLPNHPILQKPSKTSLSPSPDGGPGWFSGNEYTRADSGSQATQPRKSSRPTRHEREKPEGRSLIFHRRISSCPLYPLLFHKPLDDIPMSTHLEFNHGEMSTSMIKFTRFLAMNNRSHPSPDFTSYISPAPTAIGAVNSAVAVHVASRRWLSFLR
jgi:hypothetical protein